MKISSIFFALLCTVLISSCADPESPEQQIRSVLSTIESGIEERSLSNVADNISRDYQDHNGHNKKDIVRIAQWQILKNQNISVLSSIHSIEVNGDIASVELSAASASRGVDLNIEANRLKASSYKFSVVLKNQSGEWKITSLSWKRGW